MKRKILVVTILLLALCACAFCGCIEDNQPSDGAKMTLVIGTETPVAYTVELDNITVTDGLMSVLSYLKTTEGLNYTSQDAGYGAYLTEIGGLKQENNTYIYIYTSVAKDADVSEYASHIEYDGKTLNSAGVGASQLSFEDGCTIYIGTIVF